MRPFAPRPIRSLGVQSAGDWRLKHYSICLGAERVDEAIFAAGLEMALTTLPSPARTDVRPGLGFCILHSGRGADYIILAWWDRENELPVRVFVRDQEPGATWRPGSADESFCVWDLQVMAFERDAYVETVLASPATSTQAYLDRVVEI